MNFNNIDKQTNITQDGEGNTQINNIFPSLPPQLEANPFTPPKPVKVDCLAEKRNHRNKYQEECKHKEVYKLNPE